jgi:hypothetical protein
MACFPSRHQSREDSRHERSLRFAEDQVENPAAAHMRPRAPAVGEDLFVGASVPLQGIGQFRHAVEGAHVVNGLRQLDEGGDPLTVDADAEIRVADHVPKQTDLRRSFTISRLQSTGLGRFA